jgi:hypothetical protein
MNVSEVRLPNAAFQEGTHRERLARLEVETCLAALSLASFQAANGLLNSASHQSCLVQALVGAVVEALPLIESGAARDRIETEVRDVRSRLTLLHLSMMTQWGTAPPTN